MESRDLTLNIKEDEEEEDDTSDTTNYEESSSFGLKSEREASVAFLLTNEETTYKKKLKMFLMCRK